MTSRRHVTVFEVFQWSAFVLQLSFLACYLTFRDDPQPLAAAVISAVTLLSLITAVDAHRTSAPTTKDER